VDGLALDDDERCAVAREVLADAVHPGPGSGVAVAVALDEGVTVRCWIARAL